MKSLFTGLFLTFGVISLWGQLTTPFEIDPDRNTSATYAETIAFYEQLASRYPDQFQLQPYGSTDSGYPLHLGVLSMNGQFDPAALRQAGKLVIFVNNAIHPGEPCGVDASMLLVRDILEKPEIKLPEEIVLVIVPFYNIGGGLNRGSFSRANQEGPQAHGFRGNARNLDLNRDFIKCDSKNAQTLNQLYGRWLPDIFIDNHTSNGADYQYTITLIPTQHNKLSEPLASYLREEAVPDLFAAMKERGWEMTPYVYARDIPDNGIAGFLDLPRYSSGYAALHHALSFMPETHMLKPFGDRVQSVYHFMQAMIQLAARDKNKIQAQRAAAIAADRQVDSLAINWTLDFKQADTILFKGYEAGYKPSAISGLDRLYYDRSKPFTRPVPHYNYYQATAWAQVPEAYIIPQAYTEIIDRLHWNGVTVHRLAEDVDLTVTYDYIEDYKTGERPYEGHYLHSQVTTRTEDQLASFRTGDYVIYTDQPAVRYLVETLTPQAPDSYFAWNFFDAILQQKEYFSSYVFEDLAAEWLEEYPAVAQALEKRKQEDEAFAQSARAQLNFIYQRSPYYEPTHKRYPVARWNQNSRLPVQEE